MVSAGAHYHGEIIIGYREKASRHAKTRIIHVTCALVRGTHPNYWWIKMAVRKAKSVLSHAKAQQRNIELGILGNAGLKTGSRTN